MSCHATGARLAALAMTVVAFCWTTARAEAIERPNIIYILVDDLGKEWISCYGANDIETPRIDRLAAGGMKFNCAYSMPQCTPTRTALLSGRYPWRTGWVNHWDVPRWGVGYFDWRHEQTFARVLKTRGYKTAAAGKWQINDFRVTPDAMRKHGFDEWCMWTGGEGGNPPSNERYWDPYINTPEGSRTHQGQFGPEVFTDFVIDFLGRHKEEPMLVYFPMALTHTPFTTTPDEPEAGSKLEKHKAMVRYVDKCVGRIVDALQSLEIRERTILFFITDNGTSGGVTGRLGGRAVRGGKAKLTENGVCEPFIVNCPGLVPQGVETDALTDVTDMMPTFAELAGARLPDGYPIDGVSIAPLLLGQADDSPRDWVLVMGHGPARLDAQGVCGVDDFAERAIRGRRFKAFIDSNRKITRLHDLQNDPWEEKNLIDSPTSEHRAALAEFEALLQAMPEKDARPRYEPRESNPWDRRFGK